MDKQTSDEIKRLKEEIYKQKEAVSGIGELVKKEIDREFSTDLWELSERELDNEMGNRLSFLNSDIDPKPDTGSITSHRRLLGKPVVLFKRLLMKLARPYTNLLLEKQRRFNEQSVAFHLASFIRFRHNEKRIKALEEKLKEIQEDQELLMDRVNTEK
jgi:hypothetical protein